MTAVFLDDLDGTFHELIFHRLPFQYRRVIVVFFANGIFVFVIVEMVVAKGVMEYLRSQSFFYLVLEYMEEDVKTDLQRKVSRGTKPCV